MTARRREIELLAPARDAQVAIEAIKHGADAVYMGATRFGARVAAANAVPDVARVCDFAHAYGARVYATVNTIIYDNELAEVERLIRELYHAGVDALIVQDMGLLRLDLPPVALHASTQCDIRTPEKARFLEALGFSQLVVARELTLAETRSIRDAVHVPLEAFVHGALCVCYSGRCQASEVLMGRSANRGACAQLCRLAYDLEDADGRALARGKHLLSLRDLNRSHDLEAMIDAGVTSMKIEGRLKDVNYVKNVVAYYRQAIDRIIERRPDALARSSFGASTYTFVPDVRRSFNRSFTRYFTTERRPACGSPMASVDTPKSQGEPLGRVVSVHGNEWQVDTNRVIANGDGLSYFDAQGNYCGVRVNRATGNRAWLNAAVPVKPGTMVYRTSDKALDDVLSQSSAERIVMVDAVLRHDGEKLILTLHDERGCRVTHSMECDPLQRAQSSQEMRQQQELAKLGNTIYRLRHAQVMGEWFVPASLLARLRRDTVSLLDRSWLMRRPIAMRRHEDLAVPCPVTELASSDNVANRLAQTLYADHGVKHIEPAVETIPARQRTARPVMTTRYCLRRELGACLRDKNCHRQLPVQLYLRSGSIRLRVDCDCARCEMTVTDAGNA